MAASLPASGGWQIITRPDGKVEFAKFSYSRHGHGSNRRHGCLSCLPDGYLGVVWLA